MLYNICRDALNVKKKVLLLDVLNQSVIKVSICHVLKSLSTILKMVLYFGVLHMKHIITNLVNNDEI